jgi:hypothetical protein
MLALVLVPQRRWRETMVTDNAAAPAAIDADYLVIGAGGMGMAFVDTLIAETDARVVIVDRYHAPGGHWTLAYPFVRLHQPSTGYGVESRRLGEDAIDATGWNAGLLELASVGEVCAYFDAVMQRNFLPTGRVDYRPMSHYEGDGCFRSLASGTRFQVGPDCRIVDATYQNVTVPAMRPPPYDVGDGVRCVTPNALVGITDFPERITIVGAGKTGIDACLWLLKQGIAPERLTWIAPRDSWLIDRLLAQPGAQFADATAGTLIGTVEAVQAATSIADLFDRLEACGRLIRLDPIVRPTMYRCATVSMAEHAALQRIGDVVRLGRILRIDADKITLEQGERPVSAPTLFVDCSADGLEKRPAVPVFDGRAITLQSVRTCQQVFSAAFIAKVEAMPLNDAEKNRLCKPVPHPDTDIDFLHTTIADVENEQVWGENPALQAWLATSRLNWVRDIGPALPDEPVARAEALALRQMLMAGIAAKFAALLQSG